MLLGIASCTSDLIILQKMYPLDEIALPGALSIFPFVAQRLESAFPLVCLGLHQSICRIILHLTEGRGSCHNSQSETRGCDGRKRSGALDLL